MRFSIYLLAMLMNFVGGGALFIAAARFSEAEDGLAAGASFTVYSISYCAISFLLGRQVKPDNAARYIQCGGAIIALSSLGFIAFDGLYTQLLWLLVLGAGLAAYCTPFQVFAKSMESGASFGVVRATCLYSFSWSFGCGFGPFVFGWVTPALGFSACAVMGVMLIAGIALLEKVRRRRVAAAAALVQSPPSACANRPDLVWLGWAAGFAAALDMSLLRTIGTFRFTGLGFSRLQTSVLIAIICFGIAAGALVLLRGRNWMYRETPVFAVGLGGAAALAMFALPLPYWGFCATSVLTGLCCSAMYFLLVFHSLAHPTKSPRYVSINEIIVGITGMLGPLLGGMLTKCDTALPFELAAAITLGIAIFQQVYLIKRRDSAN